MASNLQGREVDHPAICRDRHSSPYSLCPSFRFPGGKKLLAPTIVQKPPQHGRKFVEACAGRGNITWRAIYEGLNYEEWIINDPLTYPFFKCIRAIGHTVRVPRHYSSTEHAKQEKLAAKGDQRAILLESALCFNGGTWSGGGSTARKPPNNYGSSLRIAHQMMLDKNILVTPLDWLDCLQSLDLGEDDFVVMDPPYLDCAVGPYKADQVIPAEVIAHLKNARFQWILCEYEQPLYLMAFGEPFFGHEVQCRANDFAHSRQQKRMECMWTNIRGL